MTTAIILVNLERSKLKTLGERIKHIQGITEVYTVAGEYDLVAIFRTKDPKRLSQLVTEDLSNINGITRTKTLISLDVLSDINIEEVYKI